MLRESEDGSFEAISFITADIFQLLYCTGLSKTKETDASMDSTVSISHGIAPRHFQSRSVLPNVDHHIVTILDGSNKSEMNVPVMSLIHLFITTIMLQLAHNIPYYCNGKYQLLGRGPLFDGLFYDLS
jgi:hypothetical protein